MSIWGTVPDWLIALATMGSLGYLIDYAKSARKQVEAMMRPIIVIRQQDDDAQIVNVGTGPALKVSWYNVADREEKISCREVIPPGGWELLHGVVAIVVAGESNGQGALEVSYSSVSGHRYRTIASTRPGDPEFCRALENTIIDLGLN